jgi:hypothetical protein
MKSSIKVKSTVLTVTKKLVLDGKPEVAVMQPRYRTTW